MRTVLQERPRQNAIERDNTIIYDARYFGKMLYVDQNEKLGMFGVTNVTSLDDYSGKIVAGITMPRKNNLLIQVKIQS